MARERRDRYREKVATEPSLIAEKKKCSKCGEVKGSDDFYRNNSSSERWPGKTGQALRW